MFEWHQELWRRVGDSVETLHHGLLLTGVSGTGKREFAVLLAQRLLCTGTNGALPCNECQSCKLFVAGTHPDLHVLTSENESVYGRVELLSRYSDRYQDAIARDKKNNPAQIIPVDQIRLLIERFYQSAHISAKKVALLVPADRLNVNAANALLKLLEEPPEDSHFILITDQPGLLPPTVRSRCVTEQLDPPPIAETISWLRKHGVHDAELVVSASGIRGPLDLLAHVEEGVHQTNRSNLEHLALMCSGRKDPVELAAGFSKQDVQPLLEWLQSVVVAMIKWKSAGIAPVWGPETGVDISRFDAKNLHNVYDKISKYRQLARDQINPQLALEEISIAFQRSLHSG